VPAQNSVRGIHDKKLVVSKCGQKHHHSAHDYKRVALELRGEATFPKAPALAVMCISLCSLFLFFKRDFKELLRASEAYPSSEARRLLPTPRLRVERGIRHFIHPLQIDSTLSTKSIRTCHIRWAV
jgi:hypothetical protein